MKMKKWVIAICLVIGTMAASAQDSVDVIHYDLDLDLGHLQTQQVSGKATLDIRVLCPIASLQLGLYASAVDSVWINGAAVDFNYLARTLTIPTEGITLGDTFQVAVRYQCNNHVESYGWGGLHMDNDIYYNLGVAFHDSPHGYGRCWFPSRDNFHDKATYRMRFTARPGWQTLASGLLESSLANDDGSTTSVWVQSNPTPTYLMSFASAPMHIMERSFQGLYGTYPALLGYTQDSAVVRRTFDLLDSVVPAYERCFGPYRWGRIGYVGTPKGSMEHVSNIALHNSYMTDLSGYGQTVICHELAHAWFGNLVTCATFGDMWINEGGASFCEEIALATCHGADSADQFYQSLLDEVVRTASVDDRDWLSLFNPPDAYGYGTTVYRKGALVWHSLRGYLGDSLFYAAMRRLFDCHAFGAITSQQLCDTLSAYTGVDLHSFFDFHVFGKGFVDYHVELFRKDAGGATVGVRSLLTGTDQGPEAHWVPLTFYSSALETYACRMLFNGTYAEQYVNLPFEPAFVLVDPDHELSDAATDDFLQVGNGRQSALTHFRYTLRSPSAEPFLQMSHHYGDLGADTLAGVVRCAHRYWVLNGLLPEDATLTGKFYFARSGISQAECPHIDDDFVFRNSSDSLRVLYRCHQGDPWKVLATQVSSDGKEGYCSSNHLQLGEYTLAVVDTAVASIQKPRRAASFVVHPNPNHSSFGIRLTGVEGDCELTVSDTQGRCVLRQRHVTDGDVISHDLPKGNYLLVIQNNYVSLQSQMIVQ